MHTMRPCVPGRVSLTEQPILDIRGILQNDAVDEDDSSIELGGVESERFYTAPTEIWLAIECTRFVQICSSIGILGNALTTSNCGFQVESSNNGHKAPEDSRGQGSCVGVLMN